MLSAVASLGQAQWHFNLWEFTVLPSISLALMPRLRPLMDDYSALAGCSHEVPKPANRCDHGRYTLAGPLLPAPRDIDALFAGYGATWLSLKDKIAAEKMAAHCAW